MTTAERLVKVLTEKKMTCATAESCTGGGVGYLSVEVPEGFWRLMISTLFTVQKGLSCQ